MTNKLKTLKNNDAILILMAAEHNARLTLLEQGLDFENPNNRDLLNTYTFLSIEGAISSGGVPTEAVTEFASIGIVV